MDAKLQTKVPVASNGANVDPRPPALPSVLSLLVAGHREDRLEAAHADMKAIETTLRAVIERLEIAADVAFASPPYAHGAARVIRVVTGTTDGVDRLAAEFVAARPERYRLKRVSPLTRHCGTAACPAWLVEHAVSIRDEVAVAHADVVIAAWDGREPHGFRGGTVRIMQRAALANKPVVWIGMDGHCRLLDRRLLTLPALLSLQTLETDPSMLAALFVDCQWDELARQVGQILAPDALFAAAPRSRTAKEEVVAAYFRPRPARWRGRSAGSLDAFFTALVSLNPQKTAKAARRLVAPPDDAPWIGPTWPAEIAPPSALERFFAWSDREANIAAGKRRSSVWIIAVCSFLAVLLSALGVVIGESFGPGWAFWVPFFEFVPIAATLVLFAIHRLQGVHQYWLFHRWFAEQLRFQRIVMPLDGLHPAMLRSFWNVPHAATTRPGSSSPPAGGLQAQDWLLQRVLIAEDFNFADEPHDDLPFEPWTSVAVNFAREGIKDQETYHEGKADTFHRVHRNMDYLAVGSFGATAVAVGAHLLWGLEWTFVLTTALPTAGSALTGVVDQLEAARISGQSERTSEALADYRSALRGAMGRDTQGEAWRAVWKLIEARRIGQDAVRLMAGETDDWRSVLNYRESRLS